MALSLTLWSSIGSIDALSVWTGYTAGTLHVLQCSCSIHSMALQVHSTSIWDSGLPPVTRRDNDTNWWPDNHHKIDFIGIKSLIRKNVNSDTEILKGYRLIKFTRCTLVHSMYSRTCPVMWTPPMRTFFSLSLEFSLYNDHEFTFLDNIERPLRPE